MRRRLIALACAIAMGCAAIPSLAASKEPCPSSTKGVIDKKFKPGQVWSYETRPGESASTVTILRIDVESKIGVVVHVRVDGLLAHNPRGDVVPSVEHMPFTRDAMLVSVNHLLKADQPLPTLEGLERWQADCGGVYTISIRDAVDVMEKTLNRP
ncbi:hypothetical protein [Granulicella aggregans]|uniref:hypothetical protein n=1 Tax=Granulicella aggregans TaxID=474949 RepID=UPI0021E06D45|nr:hypothetical protein [Granulicella aggregans]